MRLLHKVAITLSVGALMISCSVVNMFNSPMPDLAKVKETYTPIPKSLKELDIPTYDTEYEFNGYPFTYWHLSKQKEKQLNLEQPEVSSDSLIFRVWITNQGTTKKQPHALLEIKKNSSSWVGSLYLMSVDFSSRTLTETIRNYKLIELIPQKHDWEFVVDSLSNLKIDILPTDEKIPGYYDGVDSYANRETTYSFEYATKYNYRFYQYNNVYRASDKYWQAKNVTLILELLDDEFNWDKLGREYFGIR